MPLNRESIISQVHKVVCEGFQYVPWLSDREALTVSFEDLIGGNHLDLISNFVGAEKVEDHEFKMLGNTKTHTGSHSDWREVWSEEVQMEWERCAGHILESALGY
jgi:hypothetical protein